MLSIERSQSSNKVSPSKIMQIIALDRIPSGDYVRIVPTPPSTS